MNATALCRRKHLKSAVLRGRVWRERERGRWGGFSLDTSQARIMIMPRCVVYWYPFSNPQSSRSERGRVLFIGSLLVTLSPRPPKPRVFWGFIFGGLMCSCRLADSLRLPEFLEFLADDLSRKRVRMRGFQCSWRLTRTCLGATGMGPVPVLLKLGVSASPPEP